MKDCGNCEYFIKWTNDKYGGGLCDALDARTKSDCGHKCMHFKRRKYNRHIAQQAKCKNHVG